MDKFYVKPKRSLLSNAASNVSQTNIGHSRSLGVGRICSKIRHKIEDNLTPKISSKLYKASKRSVSMTALSTIGSATGKYTLNSKDSQAKLSSINPPTMDQSLKSGVCKASTSSLQQSPYAECYGNSTYFTEPFIDSDDEDESQLSLNLAKTSLEDEIFKELEKAAHDENQLNAVLKSFDKILFDYQKPEDNIKANLSNVEQQKADHKQTAATAIETASEQEIVTDIIAEAKTLENSHTNEQCHIKGDSSSAHIENNATDKKLLKKSQSSLSLTRRKFYQSPDSPCLRQMRHAFTKQSKSKSVWDLSNTSNTKIPIFKALPLQKRSQSFCHGIGNESKAVLNVTNKTTNITSNPGRPHSALGLNNATSNFNGKLKTKVIKENSKTTIKAKQQQILPSKPKRTTSNVSLCAPPANKPVAPVARRSKTSDELLDKCLEKGHQILHKVETLNTSPPRRLTKGQDYKKPIKRNPSNNKLSLERRKKIMNELKYANEEKLVPAPLESCKIIPPVLGETSDKHAELLVNVIQSANAFRPNNLTSIELNYDPLKEDGNGLESDSDDSGHISNEHTEHIRDHTIHSTSSLSPISVSSESYDSLEDGNIVVSKSPKIVELLKKFETKTHQQLAMNVCTVTRTPKSRICTTYKVTNVPAVELVQTHVEIYPNYTKEILFRTGILSELEAKRDELLSDRIIQLQAFCRGYLARKSMSQRRVQELAVRCIQRNVKAFMTVRDWPWWRLLVRVTPLLNVHRTEEQLKAANEELNALRAKLEKIENDRNELKTENQKLESKLSEMAVDLAEERSTANMATERLEAETGERLRLEKELTEQQAKVKSLQESTEKLEMELICARSDLNGISEDEDADNDDGNVGGAGVGVYKLKYEHVARELEFTKRRLQTQHEHDLEQLVGLKKQLEKKLADAYEEVEEQRQIVGQWKRKAQKMTNEMSDLRMLLEEQNARNNLLEKKQRKFDSECQVLQDGARQERQAKERLSREKDILIAEKFTLEQSLADTRLELDLKEEKLSSLQRELEEMTFGGSTEEEIAQLRRSKNELDRRVKEQEEELDEMAGQVQLLEQAKLRLEMSLETMRKEARREAQQRDEELEEARGSAYKKIKALECQLEAEHEERTLLLREKHELERRLSSMEDQDRVDRQVEEAANQKLRRDLRKHKALLKDAQAQLERLKADTPGKALIRQLRNQLEDAESARMLAMKTRQATEVELAEVQTLFEESNRARNEAEDKANTAQRDRAELQSQIEENEEELAELMKKFSATVKQLNTEQVAVSEFEFKISELEAERNNLKEQVMDLQHRLENIENLADPSAAMMSKRLELRTKELESRLELEQTTRTRLEVQMNRHKEALERLQTELSQCKVRELQAQDALKKSQKSFRELREEYQMVSGREQESVTRRKDLEKKIEQFESESTALRNDLRLALQRIADLQQAMEECDDDDLSESEETPSSEASLSDLEERLKPHQSKRSSGQKQNGSSASSNSTATLIREKVDNNPRITLTSPSSTQINKMAAFADKHSTVVNETKKAFRPTVNEPISNGDVSYA
ncbi:myosin heavy chain-like isoform 5-T5 [Glossina fuscipes fuscipes]